MKTCNSIKSQITSSYKQRNLEQIVKWPGGKGKELKYIIPNLPEYFEKLL